MDVSRAVKLSIVFTFFDLVLLHRSAESPKCNIQQFIPKFAKKVGCTDLKVQFGNHTLICGETLDLLTINLTPKITYDLTGKCKYATIIDINTDDIVFKPYVYYLVHNIPVKLLKEGFKGQNQDVPLGGSDVGDYGARYAYSKTLVSGPVGYLHYVYFVYCQCYKIPKSDIKEYHRLDRRYFDIKNYTKEKRLGNPIAGIYHVYSPTGLPVPTLVENPPTVL